MRVCGEHSSRYASVRVCQRDELGALAGGESGRLRASSLRYWDARVSLSGERLCLNVSYTLSLRIEQTYTSPLRPLLDNDLEAISLASRPDVRSR